MGANKLHDHPVNQQIHYNPYSSSVSMRLIRVDTPTTQIYFKSTDRLRIFLFFEDDENQHGIRNDISNAMLISRWVLLLFVLRLPVTHAQQIASGPHSASLAKLEWRTEARLLGQSCLKLSSYFSSYCRTLYVSV
jgi:hypothetical protein